MAPEWAAQCSPAPPVHSHPWSRGVPLAGQAVESSLAAPGRADQAPGDSYPCHQDPVAPVALGVEPVDPELSVRNPEHLVVPWARRPCPWEDPCCWAGASEPYQGRPFHSLPCSQGLDLWCCPWQVGHILQARVSDPSLGHLHSSRSHHSQHSHHSHSRHSHSHSQVVSSLLVWAQR